jgi:hypothetical protein
MIKIYMPISALTIYYSWSSLPPSSLSYQVYNQPAYKENDRGKVDSSLQHTGPWMTVEASAASSV